MGLFDHWGGDNWNSLPDFGDNNEDTRPLPTQIGGVQGRRLRSHEEVGL